MLVRPHYLAVNRRGRAGKPGLVWGSFCQRETHPPAPLVAHRCLFPVLLLIVLQMVTSPGPPHALALGLSIALKVGAGHFVLPKPIVEQCQYQPQVPPRGTISEVLYRVALTSIEQCLSRLLIAWRSILHEDSLRCL